MNASAVTMTKAHRDAATTFRRVSLGKLLDVPGATLSPDGLAQVLHALGDHGPFVSQLTDLVEHVRRTVEAVNIALAEIGDGPWLEELKGVVIDFCFALNAADACITFADRAQS